MNVVELIKLIFNFFYNDQIAYSVRMRKTLAGRSNIINLIDEGKKATEISDEFFADRSQILRWFNQKEEIDKLITGEFICQTNLVILFL